MTKSILKNHWKYICNTDIWLYILKHMYAAMNEIKNNGHYIGEK